MKAIFNLFSNQITGLDRECMPSEQYIYLPYPISLSKTIPELTGSKIQKANEDGQPLYKKNVGIDSMWLETWEETTESREVTEWKEVPHTYRVATEETTTEIQVIDGVETPVEVPVYKEITTISQEPAEWIDYEPIMVDEYADKIYNFEETPYMFTYSEVIEAKEKSISANRETTLAFFTCFDEKMEFLDLASSSGVDTGNGFISIQAQGYAVTNPITLDRASSLIEVYSEKQTQDSFDIFVNDILINDQKQVSFDIEVTEVVVKFVNNADTRRELYAYGILI